MALVGVLQVNLLTAFRVSLWGFYFGPPQRASGSDALVLQFLHRFLEFKAFVAFALLFGAGLEILHQRSGLRAQLRRLLALLPLGLVHLVLVWDGDILTLYALLGLLAAPALLLPAPFLLTFALILLALSLLPFPLLLPPMPDFAIQAEAGYRGGLLQVQATRWHELPFILSLLGSAAARTLGLFWLGAWLWRGQRRWARGGWLVFLGSPWSPVFQGLGYVWLFMRVWEFQPALLAWAASPGRMALTNYLLQSVILGWLFYGYGLSLMGRVGPAQAALLGGLVYLAQAAFSAWWLRHFQHGPAEWLWLRLRA